MMDGEIQPRSGTVAVASIQRCDGADLREAGRSSLPIDPPENASAMSQGRLGDLSRGGFRLLRRDQTGDRFEYFLIPNRAIIHVDFDKIFRQRRMRLE